jgi:hypothetical protein
VFKPAARQKVTNSTSGLKSLKGDNGDHLEGPHPRFQTVILFRYRSIRPVNRDAVAFYDNLDHIHRESKGLNACRIETAQADRFSDSATCLTPISYVLFAGDGLLNSLEADFLKRANGRWHRRDRSGPGNCRQQRKIQVGFGHAPKHLTPLEPL